MGDCCSKVQDNSIGIREARYLQTKGQLPSNQRQQLNTKGLKEQQTVSVIFVDNEEQEPKKLQQNQTQDSNKANQVTQNTLQSVYYSKLHKHEKEHLNVYQPSVFCKSLFNRLEFQDPKTQFFKGLPKFDDSGSIYVKKDTAMNELETKQISK